MNKVSIIGNVTKDLELKTSENGGATYVNFTVAINEYSSGANEDKAIFVRVVAFGRKAEVLSIHLSKGSKIAIDGKLSTSSYINKNGDKAYSTEIIVEEFTFVGSKKVIS
ncbi:MAG: single-stranded DNA-binding protein [Clostridium sp.]